MLVAVKGYYDGNKIVVDEDDCASLSVGDEVIITIFNKIGGQGAEVLAERRRRCLYGSQRKIVEEISGFMREMQVCWQSTQI